jgi:hypothetical protein
MAAIFDESLTVSWGVLGLLSFENQIWIARPERFQPFLDAVIPVWDELDAVGSRYVVGMQGESLWSIRTTCTTLWPTWAYRTMP